MNFLDKFLTNRDVDLLHMEVTASKDNLPYGMVDIYENVYVYLDIVIGTELAVIYVVALAIIIAIAWVLSIQGIE
jgi:hypothetical protein